MQLLADQLHHGVDVLACWIAYGQSGSPDEINSSVDVLVCFCLWKYAELHLLGGVMVYDRGVILMDVLHSW